MNNLNDLYQLSMIIVGFGGLILGWLTLIRTIKKEKHKNKKRY
jgi:hypothetical protein